MTKTARKRATKSPRDQLADAGIAIATAANDQTGHRWTIRQWVHPATRSEQAIFEPIRALKSSSRLERTDGSRAPCWSPSSSFDDQKD
jgi:hypothetical protein